MPLDSKHAHKDYLSASEYKTYRQLIAGSIVSGLGLVVGSPAAFAFSFFGVLRATANQDGGLALILGFLSYFVVAVPLAIVFNRTTKRVFDIERTVDKRHGDSLGGQQG